MSAFESHPSRPPHDSAPASAEPSSQLPSNSLPAAATVLSRLRRNSRLGLCNLSAATAIPAARLREIEEGRTVPELRDLWSLARAFEVPFRLLLAGPRFPDKGFHVLRRNAGRTVTSSEGRFRCRALSAAGDPREPEVYEISLEPGCVEEADAHAEDTFEHIVVVRGALTVSAGASSATLFAGDTIFFGADVAHSYANTGSEEAVALLTMTNSGDWVGE